MNDQGRVEMAKTLGAVQVFDNTWAGWHREARWLLQNLAGRVEYLAAENERLRCLIDPPAGAASAVGGLGSAPIAGAPRAGGPSPQRLASPTT